MYKFLLLTAFALLSAVTCCFSQNVFNPSDPIVRYNSGAALGSSTNPNPNKAGMQKWVSVPTTGVSKGVDMYDASSYKAYFININGNKMAFRLKFPYSYSRPEGATKKYPMMLFLHGAGEVGCSTNGGIYNNERPIWLGGNLFRQRVDNNQFDGFLIYPQLVATDGCWGAWQNAPNGNFAALIAIVDSLIKYCRADIDRLLVDGLSGGGYGAWKMAALYPQRVAKIMPSSAAGNTADRALFVHIPIWFATGGKDPDPSPAQAQYSLTRMQEIGADIRYTIYPDLGHAVWETFWREPDFVSAMNDMHKANPLVFFQKTDYCPSQAINTKLGITPGFYAYEWQKDNVNIATRTGTTNTILNSSVVISFTGNEINVKAVGTYRVRFKRFLNSAWSAYSMKPAVIKIKSGGQAPPITVTDKRSIVLPAPDGSTTAPLNMPSGFASYQWVRVSDNVTVSTAATYNAPVGTYKAKYTESGGCGPTFSPNFTVVNANGTPKPDPATGLAITVLSTTSVKLTWVQKNNETGFEIYRSTTPGSKYTFLALVPANTTTYTDATLATNTTYYYVVRAVNGTGAAANSNEASPNGGNKAPVIAGLSDLFVKSGTTASRSFTVTDAASDIVTVTIPNKPAFITLTHVSGFNYKITATATVNDVGFNNITINASDNKGMSATQSINVLVADKYTRSAFVNLGASGKTASAPWNNWLGNLAANATISNIKDESNVATTIDITAVTAWATTTVLGHISGNNSGVFPDAVLQSGVADNGTARTFRFSGLNTAKRYNIVFVGSQNEGIVATTQYAQGTQKSVLDARYNTQKTANLNSLVPDGAGQITVTATRTGSTPYSYLNGIVVEEYDPSITLLNPDNLYVEPIDRSSVMITWSDKTNNESATAGYELQRATNSAFSAGLATISLPGNTTSYKNTGLIANTKYYYRVRAKNGSAASGYSNVVATITPSMIMYVNFNTTIANAPYPWNNLAASPMNTFTFNNLKNQSGTSTGISLKLEKPFNGEFTAGASTGNGSGVVPDNVLQSDFWLDNTQLSEFRVIGLNTTKRYRFGFIGSSSSNGWFKGNYTSTYTINGRTVYLNSWMNNTKIVYIGDVVPNSSGQVLLDFSTTAAAGYGFNAGLIIEEYNDATGGTLANSLVLEEESVDSAVMAPEDLTRFRIYPNPFRDQVNVEFNNTSFNNMVSAEMYDLYGRLVYRKDYEHLPVGRNNITLSMPQDRSTTMEYLMVLKVNGKVLQSGKLMRSK